MAIDTILAVFENFNDPIDALPSQSDEDAPPPFDDLGEIRAAAWTDGYLTGCQGSAPPDADQPLTAKLLTSLYDLDLKASAAVDAAALAVADLLVNTVITATSENWSARLLERVRIVAGRVKPALTITPEFMLRDDQGAVHCFADISELSHALEGGNIGEDVTIRWHRGEATISRMAFLEDLREAIIPLSAGQPNQQTPRSIT